MRWAPSARSAFAERAAAIADAYRSTAGQALVVCATHDEIERVTEAIRGASEDTRGTRRGQCFTRHVSLNWTGPES